MFPLVLLSGFQDITIFEKEDRVGGKAHTIEINGRKYDTGTFSSYKDPMVMDLIKEVGLIEETSDYDPAASRTYSPSADKLLNKSELVQELVGDGLMVKLRIGWELIKLEQLYHKFVDEYGFPKETHQIELSKPLDEFLTDHGIEALRPLIQYRLKSQGYDRGGVSAFLALFFLDPKFLRAQNGIIEMSATIGWQDVWEKLVEIHGMQVVYNTSVNTVHFVDNEEGASFVNLTTFNELTGKSEIQKFGFCIIDIPEPLSILTNPSLNQERCLSKYNNFTKNKS